MTDRDLLMQILKNQLALMRSQEQLRNPAERDLRERIEETSTLLFAAKWKDKR